MTVTPVPTAGDPTGLYHFNITFNGNDGYGILAKLMVVNATNSQGTMWPAAPVWPSSSSRQAFSGQSHRA